MFSWYSFYQQRWIDEPCPQWWHVFKRFGHYRHPRVQQERRSWFRLVEEEVRLRRRRSPQHLDPSGALEKFPSCIEMKSWKKLYKKKHQWKSK